MIYGIDLSHWNNVQEFANFIDNNTKNKIDFVILKISQYVAKDNMFEHFYTRVTNKYKVGGYIYNKAKNVSQAETEAKFAVECLKGKTMDAWVWLDMEDATLKGVGKSNLTKIIDTEANILKSAGYNVGIYCNLDWYKNVLDSNKLKERYKFWIARYPSDDKGIIKESLNPKTYDGVIMWQYSSKGGVKGIIGNVDMNVLYENIFTINKVETAQPQNNTTTTTYTVKSGDTLSKIGTKLGVDWKKIADLNGIKSPYTIKVGQVLKISNTAKPTNIYYPKYNGAKTTLINALNYLNIDSTFSFRKNIAKANGISLYIGNAKQNNQIYDLLVAGKLKRV